MKIERVNENKIKILIDDNEAKEWNITTKNISENTPEAQRMFWHAIRLAKESIDFSVDGAKLFVETIPGCESGIGMLITRVCNNGELEAAINNCSYRGKIRKTSLKPVAEKHHKFVYEFSCFESVCEGAKILKGLYAGINTLYKMGESFYLCLMPKEPILLGNAELKLCEFAQKLVHGQYVQGRLNEYGVKMIENNAIDVLNEYFA